MVVARGGGSFDGTAIVGFDAAVVVEGGFDAAVVVGSGVGVEGCAGGLAFAGATVAVELPTFSVPFAATSCNILLLDGATGVVFVGLSSAFFVVLFALLDVAAFGLFLTTSSPFTLFGAFGDAFVAFVEAFLVPVFATSSTVSSMTFLGRPRPRFAIGSVVDIMRNCAQWVEFQAGGRLGSCNRNIMMFDARKGVLTRRGAMSRNFGLG